LSDEQWARLRRVLPQRRQGPRSKIGDRHFIDAVLYRARTGVPWRDLPARFGPWKSVYNRFANWAQRGVWELVFRELQLEYDDVGSIIDGTVVRAHQDAAGGRGGSNAMLWAVLEEAFHRSSTPLSIRMDARSTSR
jgi:transposase